MELLEHVYQNYISSEEYSKINNYSKARKEGAKAALESFMAFYRQYMTEHPPLRYTLGGNSVPTVILYPDISVQLGLGTGPAVSNVSITPKTSNIFSPASPTVRINEINI